MEHIDTVKNICRSLEDTVGTLRESLLPIMNRPLDDLLRERKTPKEEVQFLNTYVYCLVSIIFAAIKTSGGSTEDHPIMKELDRVKASMNRLKNFDKVAENKAKASAESQEKSKEFLQRTLGTTGGAAAPDSLKGPAISQANFQGTHTRFEDNDNKSDTNSTAGSSGSTKTELSSTSGAKNNMKKKKNPSSHESANRKNKNVKEKVTKPKKNNNKSKGKKRD